MLWSSKKPQFNHWKVWFFFLTLASASFTGVNLHVIKAKPIAAPDEHPAPEFRAVVGGKAELPCNITTPSTDDAISLVLWYRTDTGAPIYSLDSRNGQVDKAKHFAAELLGPRAFFDITSRPGFLRIQPVKEEDAGEYRCRVDYRWARTQNSNSALKVIVPPQQVIITDQTGHRLHGIIGSFDDGSSLHLICEAEGGNPPPVVTWWRDSLLIDDTYELSPEGNVQNVLHLTELDRSDLMAQLTCQAANNNITVPVAASVTLDLNWIQTNKWKLKEDNDGKNGSLSTSLNFMKSIVNYSMLLLWNFI